MTPLEQKIYRIITSPKVEAVHKPRLIISTMKELGEDTPVWDLEQECFCATQLYAKMLGKFPITMTNVSKADLQEMFNNREMAYGLKDANFSQLRESIDRLYKLLSEKNYSKESVTSEEKT